LSFEDLKKYDTRATLSELKRLVDLDAKLGFAFRMAVEKARSGELTCALIRLTELCIGFLIIPHGACMLLKARNI
jgi:hypothetical protein